VWQSSNPTGVLVVSFSENSGSTTEDAIVISDARNASEGVGAEYEYLTSLFGQRGKTWQLEGQALLNHEGKMFDRMNVLLANGTKLTLYFDITDFFGKY
jgi:hypothetical protein